MKFKPKIEDDPNYPQFAVSAALEQDSGVGLHPSVFTLINGCHVVPLA